MTNDASYLNEEVETGKRYQTRSKVPSKPNWKVTMSDISLKESKLFVSS
jgi:hypothetical protein